ncbi:DUF2442 domain-containing protein [Rhizobium sp. SEMIA 4085]|nr:MULTISPECIES: DUF2442 domain-containing protein [Rhizobium]NNH32470.1 DUF2442 domain-containing protein [Rhizobium sp. SEMIA 4085]
MARKRRGRRSYRRDTKGPDRKKSLGSGLDEIGFQPLGRRIVLESACDAEGPLKHPAPSGAHYDRSTGRITVEFNNGSAFMVPARSLQGLVEASESDIAEVEVLGETGLHWESLDVDHEIALLISGVFGTPSFIAESATRAMELHNKMQNLTVTAWAGPVIDYLSHNIPYNHEVGWEHYHMTAYEVGCLVLAALGQADEIDGGARPRLSPVLSDVPPRWDDISTAVIYVAAQNAQLQYRPFRNRVPSSKADAGDDSSEPNIAAANGVGPAYATSEAYSVLEALGLVREERWTKAAETVLWRDNPREWNLEFTSDARFIMAAFDAAAAIPEDIRSQIDTIVAATSEETTRVVQTPNLENEGKSDFPPDAVPPKRLRSMLEDSRRHHLDVLFFRRWRFSDGWLSANEAKSTLEIHHDALAISMRKAVMSWLYPSLPLLAL